MRWIKKTKGNYRNFLKSKFWIKLRNLKLAMSGYKCFECLRTDHLQCHHKFYRDDWYDTQLDDLVVLCEDCHHKQHPEKPLPSKVKFTPHTGDSYSQFKHQQAMARKRNRKFRRPW